MAVSFAMLRVVYRSLPSRSPEGVLLDIARAAERNNTRDACSGVLFHDEAAYLQLLEGAPEAVARRMDDIRKDTRHRIVWEAAQDIPAHAISPRLPMGYVSAAESADAPGAEWLVSARERDAAAVADALIRLAARKYPSCVAPNARHHAS